MNATALCDFWNVAIQTFLDGGSSVPRRLTPWFDAYKGRGRGEVMVDALPEPWLGRLGPEPRAVFLQLNPGLAVDYQLRRGLFADEIRTCGSYSVWTASWPYQRQRNAVPDPILVSSNESMPSSKFWGQAARFGRVRLKFAQNWFADEALTFDDVVMFELYPWHSRGLTGSVRPPSDFIQEYIWEPIADVGTPIVFAFGASWFDELRRLDVDVLSELNGSNGLGSSVASRSVMIAQARKTRTMIVAEKHAGAAGPPRASEVPVLRSAYERVLGETT